LDLHFLGFLSKGCAFADSFAFEKCLSNFMACLEKIFSYKFGTSSRFDLTNTSHASFCQDNFKPFLHMGVGQTNVPNF